MRVAGVFVAGDVQREKACIVQKLQAQLNNKFVFFPTEVNVFLEF